MDKKQFLIEKHTQNDFGRGIDIYGAETKKPELRCFQGLFDYNDEIKKFVEIVKDCWKTKLNAQQPLRVIHELIRLKSQRSQKTQSIALTIFAPFAFFAVEFLCFPNVSQDTNTRGN